MQHSLVRKAYIVPGLPHILLSPEKSPGWARLHQAYQDVRADIARQDADVILYFSTQWLSILGYMLQADPQPSGVHVDQEWHELGSIPYEFRVDTALAESYADEIRQLGYQSRLINYQGFPIDTGTIVAQKLLNPDNRLAATMVSCNVYSGQEETTRLGEAALRALQRTGKKAVVVLVSSLSHRFHEEAIDPKLNRLSSPKDDECNRQLLALLQTGDLNTVAQRASEFALEAHGDQQFKGMWWLHGILGQSQLLQGQVFAYEPVYGSGAAVVSLAKRAQEIPDYAIDSPGSAEAVGSYPHARRYGDLLFLSGIGPRQQGSKEIPGITFNAERQVIAHDIRIQTRAVIANVQRILEDAGSTLAKVLDVQVFLTDMANDFKGFNEVYNEAFNTIRPTRTTVEVGALPTPIAVEFKVIARP